MDLLDRINNNFHDNVRHVQVSLELLADPVLMASQAITRTLLGGGSIITCGSGASAACAQLFCCNMLNVFDQPRPGLPAISLNNDAGILSAILQSEGARNIYARQINALGEADDLLLVITTRDDPAMENAIHAAHGRDMRVIALTSIATMTVNEQLESDDIEIRSTTGHTARSDELHHLVINCLCDLTDQQLLGS